MVLQRILRGKPARKYPIMRDRSGRTARSKAMTMFSRGKGPKDACERLGLTYETASKYYQQWKKDPGLEERYAYARKTLQKGWISLDDLAKGVARVRGARFEDVRDELTEPWGLKRLCAGKLRSTVGSESQIAAIFDLAFMVVRHMAEDRISLPEVKEVFEEVLAEILESDEDDFHDDEVNGEDQDSEDESDSDDLGNDSVPLKRASVAYRQRNRRPISLGGSPMYRQRSISRMPYRMAVPPMSDREKMRRIIANYRNELAKVMRQGHSEGEARDLLYQSVLKEAGPEVAARYRRMQDDIHPWPRPDKPGLSNDKENPLVS